VRQKAWALLAAVILLNWMCRPVRAQADGPTMHVTVGFDGYCPYGDGGGWCPVYAVLSNDGVGVDGELRVLVGGAPGGTAPHVYARRILLPARSRKAYFLALPSAESSSRSRLEVQFIAGGEVLSSEQAAVTWLREEDRLYGVVSSSPSALNFLSDVAPVGGSAAVAHLDLEALPPDPLGWDGLDVLILSDVDTTALSGEQRQALETWVAHGGHLVVGGGAGATRTVAGIADLLPVTVGGARPVDDLRVLGEWWGVPVAPGPYAVAEAVLRDGEVVIEQRDERGDLIVLARRTHGAGTVDFVAFEAGLNPFTRWEDNARLWELIVGAGDAGSLRFTIHDGHNAREAVNAIPGLELPSMLQILAFMLVYTLLVGPVNYVVLRKLDRRELAWLTIPAIIFGFTVCAYVTGFQIRGGLPIVHRLAAVYVPQGTSVGRASEVVGLFSPRRTRYDVWVAGAGVREMPGAAYGGPARQPLHVVEEAGGSTVVDLRVDVGGIQPFLAEGYVDVPGIEADLRLVGDTAGALRLEGTLRNGRAPLQNAVLVVGDDEQRLGDLEPGQAISVSTGVGFSLPPFEDVADRILGPGAYYNDRNLYRRYQFLQAVFASGVPYAPRVTPGGAGLGSGVRLIGWAEGAAPLPVEVVGRPFSTVETALYVYDLPVAGLTTGATATIPPGLITREVLETTGYVDVRPEGFYMEPGEGITFRFTIWPGVTVRRVDGLVLTLKGAGSGSPPGRPPVASLWNGERAGWDRLEVGWGEHSIPNAQAYVLPSGAVLARLEADAEWPADVENVTITIKGQW
jgi:hypothetical protein